MDNVVLGTFRPELTSFTLLLVAGDGEGLFKKEAGLKEAFENNGPLRFFTVMKGERQ